MRQCHSTTTICLASHSNVTPTIAANNLHMTLSVNDNVKQNLKNSKIR